MRPTTKPTLSLFKNIALGSSISRFARPNRSHVIRILPLSSYVPGGHSLRSSPMQTIQCLRQNPRITLPCTPNSGPFPATTKCITSHKCPYKKACVISTCHTSPKLGHTGANKPHRQSDLCSNPVKRTIDYSIHELSNRITNCSHASKCHYKSPQCSSTSNGRKRAPQVY
jgi:hypothetical protein